MGNERVGDCDRVGRLVVEHVETSSGKTGFSEDVANGPEAFWRQLRALEDRRVACGQGDGDCTGSEDIGGIPEDCQPALKPKGCGCMKPTMGQLPKSHRTVP